MDTVNRPYRNHISGVESQMNEKNGFGSVIRDFGKVTFTFRTDDPKEMFIKVNTKFTKKGKMFFTNLGNNNYPEELLIFSI